MNSMEMKQFSLLLLLILAAHSSSRFVMQGSTFITKFHIHKFINIYVEFTTNFKASAINNTSFYYFCCLNDCFNGNPSMKHLTAMSGTSFLIFDCLQ